MTEYKVVVVEITNVFFRDVNKAAEALTAQVSAEMASGWEPHGGLCSVSAGTSASLLQAMTRRR